MPRFSGAAVAALALVWAGLGTASAHEFSRSTARVVVEGRTVRAAFAIGAASLHRGPAIDVDGDGVASVEEVDAAIGAIFAALKEHYRLTADGVPPVTAIVQRYGIDGDTLRLDLVYTFAAPVGALTIESTLPALTQPDHRHLLSVVSAGGSSQGLLDAATPRATFAGGPPLGLVTARRFLALGIEHIFTGYDHLAFLVVLLVGAAGLVDVAKIVTAFTVAHSLTLALATFDLVTVPPLLVEVLIAFSIAWVAIENLVAEQVQRRWRITFLFGLIHGFGFANVLRDMDLPPSSLALSLFTFNAGVEVGQLVFVFVTLPLVRLLGSRWHPRLALVCSSVVLCTGVYWFVQRLLAT